MRAAPWLSALLLGACLPSPPRVPRAVFSLSSVVVSNSPTRVERHEPIVKDGRVTVDYSLLFDNRGERVLLLMATQATATLADTVVEAACRERGDTSAARDLAVPPGERLRLDCRLTAPGGAGVLASRGDQDLTLVLPVAAPPRVTTLSFKYPLRLEDAQ